MLAGSVGWGGVGDKKRRLDGWLGKQCGDAAGWGQNINTYSLVSSWEQGGLAFSSRPPLKGVRKSSNKCVAGRACRFYSPVSWMRV